MLVAVATLILIAEIFLPIILIVLPISRGVSAPSSRTGRRRDQITGRRPARLGDDRRILNTRVRPSVIISDDMAKGDERLIEDAFVRYLERGGWKVHRQVDFLDVRAERNGEVLCAEVKGRTGQSQNLDLDTVFGQLLRRMTSPEFRYAVVVPDEAVNGVARVPAWVRDALGIEVYSVRLPEGDVTRVTDK